MKFRFYASLALLSVSCILPHAKSTYAQSVIFVDADATGSNTGTSWDNAFNSLQLALAKSEAGDEIWVAEGRYIPVVPADPTRVTKAERDISFELKSGVALYGGFSGSETRRDERDWEAHHSILSGDVLGNDNENISIEEQTREDNSYNVVLAGHLDRGGVDSNAIVDGFIISDGNANEPLPSSLNIGGGLYVIFSSSPQIRNTVLRNNSAIWGGGMACLSNTIASPTITNVLFENNVAFNDGGGAYSITSFPIFREVVFRNNRSECPFERECFGGGGMFSRNGATSLINTTFKYNSSQFRGGGFYGLDEKAIVLNGKFLGNETVGLGGGLYTDLTLVPPDSRDFPRLINVVFSGNRTSDPAIGGGAGMSNLNANPFLSNVTFSGNHAANQGGGMRNTRSMPTVRNSIFWNNAGTNGGDHLFNFNNNSTIVVVHSLVPGDLPDGTVVGSGMLDVDPLFVDDDGPDNIFGTLDDNVRLLSGSPAIDSGNNALVFNDPLDWDNDGNTSEPYSIDLDGNMRIFDGASGVATVDMGAYEFGAPPVVIFDRGLDAEDVDPPGGDIMLTSYPNPFSSQATIRYDLEKTGHVVLKVYDLLGREVATLVDQMQAAGEKEVRFDGAHLANGLYLCRLETQSKRMTLKMLLSR